MEGIPEDPALVAISRLYDLAEALSAGIGVLVPDWCQIARDAHELATGAELRCQQRKNT